MKFVLPHKISIHPSNLESNIDHRHKFYPYAKYDLDLNCFKQAFLYVVGRSISIKNSMIIPKSCEQLIALATEISHDIIICDRSRCHRNTVLQLVKGFQTSENVKEDQRPRQSSKYSYIVMCKTSCFNYTRFSFPFISCLYTADLQTVLFFNLSEVWLPVAYAWSSQTEKSERAPCAGLRCFPPHRRVLL